MLSFIINLRLDAEERKKNIMLPPVASGKHFIFTQDPTKKKKKWQGTPLKHFDVSCLLQLILMGVTCGGHFNHQRHWKPKILLIQSQRVGNVLYKHLSARLLALLIKTIVILMDSTNKLWSFLRKVNLFSSKSEANTTDWK